MILTMIIDFPSSKDTIGERSGDIKNPWLSLAQNPEKRTFALKMDNDAAINNRNLSILIV